MRLAFRHGRPADAAAKTSQTRRADVTARPLRDARREMGLDKRRATRHGEGNS